MYAPDNARAPAPAPVRHSRFYVSNVNVTLQVENTLFQIPKSCLQQYSEIFAHLFEVPQLEAKGGSTIQGQSDENPIRLEGVTVVEFESLLKVIFPIKASENAQDDLSNEDWVAILKLATMWRFLEIRQTAIRVLDERSMPLVRQVVLGKAYDVPTWLRAGYLGLLRRGTKLTPDEAQRIGWASAFTIAHLRESYLERELATAEGKLINMEPGVNVAPAADEDDWAVPAVKNRKKSGKSKKVQGYDFDWGEPVPSPASVTLTFSGLELGAHFQEEFDQCERNNAEYTLVETPVAETT
ncbi:BTB domain-containing protein [Mycena kentingensis (nom. inval.)]|nr:BTB domain-containing protein [Mycena kentingensis (nom. inval.)]